LRDEINQVNEDNFSSRNKDQLNTLNSINEEISSPLLRGPGKNNWSDLLMLKDKIVEENDRVNYDHTISTVNSSPSKTSKKPPKVPLVPSLADKI